MEVGQQVYYLRLGYGKKIDDSPTPTTVTKVGRKWFEVEGLHQRFDIEKLTSDGKGYSPSHRIILSISDYNDEKEYQKLSNQMREYFGMYNTKKATLEQLRQIDKILNQQ